MNHWHEIFFFYFIYCCFLFWFGFGFLSFSSQVLLQYLQFSKVLPMREPINKVLIERALPLQFRALLVWKASIYFFTWTNRILLFKKKTILWLKQTTLASFEKALKISYVYFVSIFFHRIYFYHPFPPPNSPRSFRPTYLHGFICFLYRKEKKIKITYTYACTHTHQKKKQ